MSLVADYGSDSSSEAEEENITTSSSSQNTSKSKGTSSSSLSLASLLPLPKGTVGNVIKSKKKSEGPVKIFIDSPKVPGETDEKEESESRKRVKLNDGGLFAMLPAPKRTVVKGKKKETRSSTETTTVEMTSLVPRTLSKQKKTEEKKIDASVPKVENDSDNPKEDSNDKDESSVSGSFFPIGAEVTNIIKKKYETNNNSNKEKLTTQNSMLPEEQYNVEYYSSSLTMLNDNNPEYRQYYGQNPQDGDAESYEEYQQVMGSEEGYVTEESPVWNQQDYTTSQQSELPLDEEIIAKLGGRRNKKERGSTTIQIKEINARDQMGSEAWRQQMAQLTKPGSVSNAAFSHLKPTKGQKRKHNLMYLAYQATAMENDLKEQFAANRKTKRETQAKYGF